MQLRFLELRNFRLFDERELELSQSFTLLSGSNNSGKTSVLDAISISLGSFLSGLGLSAPTLQQSDVRAAAVREQEVPDNVRQAASLVAQVELAGKAYLQSCQLPDGERGPGNLDKPDEIGSAGRRYARELSRGSAVELPVLAYYRAAGSASAPARRDEEPAVARLRTYSHCLEFQDIEHRAVELLQRLLAGGSEDESAEAALDAIRAVLTTSVGDSDPVRLELEQQELLVSVGDERPTRWQHRGSAFRRVAAIHADLAHRCARLNPHHGEAAPLRTEGVVLIDELEAHLHPRWQRYVIEDLRRCFPRIQFIATTSSPFIIQSLHDGALIDLDNHRPTEHSSLSIEDITEQVLGVHMPQRSKRFQDMLAAGQEYMAILARGEDASPEEREALKARLDELTLPFSDNPGFHAILAAERLGTSLEGEDE